MIILSTQSSYSQSTYDNIYENNGVNVPDSLAGPVDTLGGNSEVKPKKPFRSPLFADSVKKVSMFRWNIRLDDASIEMVDLDTSLIRFEKNYPFIENNIVGAASIGTLGGGAVPYNYASRYSFYENSFASPYGDYFLTPENAPFYNVKRPYTKFEYFTAGQRRNAEEHFLISHAQNISPSSSFDIYYRNNRKRGHYDNQQSINKNLAINFAHLGRGYTVFMGYINNSADNHDNGGIKDIGDIIDTTFTDIPESGIETNIRAASRVSENIVYFTQSVAIPLVGDIDSTTDFKQIPTLSLGTSFKYGSYRRLYRDLSTETNDYYDNWYFDPTRTRDSTNEKQTDLKFFAKYQPYSAYGEIANIVGGIGYTNERYYNFKPLDYISPPQETDKKNSIYAYGQLNGGYYQFLQWKANVKYYPIGYRSQDIELGGDVKLMFGKDKMPLHTRISADFSSSTPSYWAQNYNSNHFIWHNNFGKENKLELDFNFTMPAINLELGFTQNFNQNTIYFDANTLPSQFDGLLSVTSLYLRKDFKWKGLHLQHRANVQFSSNQLVAPVPLVAVNLTYFYDITVVKDVMNVEIGFDAYFNTKYYGFGYNPAVGQFYNQREYTLGNYPMLDLFIVGKWKRLRFILKLQHANFGWTDNRNYIEIADYPLNPLMFTFGFSWNFYD